MECGSPLPLSFQTAGILAGEILTHSKSPAGCRRSHSLQPPPHKNALRNSRMLFGTAVSGFSFPSISSDTNPL